MKGFRPWLLVVLLLGLPASGRAAENFTLRVWQVRDGLPQNQVSAITQTPDGYLWFGTMNGLARFDGVEFRVFDHTNTERMESSRVEGLRVDEEGLLRVELEGGRSGLFNEAGFQTIESPGGRALEESADAIAPSAKGGVWIAGERRIRRFVDDALVDDYGTYSFASPMRVTAMLEDRHGQLWLATDGHGVLCYQGTNRADDFRLPQGMPENRVRCLFEDRDGNVWAGTDGGGVVRFRPRLFQSPAGPSDVMRGRVNSVAVDKSDDVWVGTEDAGLHVWNGEQLVSALPEAQSRIVTVLAETSGMSLLVGTDGQGLFRVRRRGMESLELSHEEIPGFRGKRVQALRQNDVGAIWVGTPNGLAEFYDGRIEWSDVGDVRCVEQTTDGAIWVGLHGAGLLRFHGDDYERFDRESGLPDDYVWSLRADEDGGLWIGTFGGGLARFYAGDFKTVGVRDGLPDKVIGTILADQTGDLWLGSQRGVLFLQRKLLDEFFAGRRSRVAFRLFDQDDGMGSAQCVGGHQPNGVAANTGELIFSTRQGAVMIDPERVDAESVPPKIVIESLRVNEVRRFESLPGRGRAGERPAITAGPGRTRIGIHYVGMDFGAPDRVTYRQRLLGRDDAWLDAGGQRTAIFGDLEPGNYRFEVIAVKADGTSSSTPASIAFSILPHFWQTAWFRLLAILGGAGLVGWMVRLVSLRRLRRQMEQLERELAVQNERTRIANDMHDDLGARLTQLAFLSDVARQDPVDGRLADLGETARDTAASLDQLVWTVNPKNDRLDRLIHYLADQAREFCEGTGLQCRVDLPAQIPEVEVSGDFRHNLFLVVKEALNNTAKHAQATAVELRMEIDGNRLEIVVTDDGCGFDVGERADAGNGLANYSARIETLNGVVSLHSQPGQGTRLEISVPLP